MVPRENKNNAYAKFGGTNKEYHGIFRNGVQHITEVLQVSQSNITTQKIKDKIGRYTVVTTPSTPSTTTSMARKKF